MRKLILLTIAAGMVWAQQPAADDTQAKLQVVALEAQIAAAKADAAALEAQMDDLGKRYSDNYPQLATARKMWEEAHQREILLERQLARMKYLIWNEAFPAPAQPSAESPKIALPDRWWKNSVTSQYLGLTADQQKKMDDVLQQFRLRLATTSLELRREEDAMEPLVSAAPLDEAKITAQIDRVAGARAELEKTNGRMLLGIRKLLTPDQWVKLNQAFTLSLTQK
jgi:Spy/CpxP family protein refolding chaperone